MAFGWVRSGLVAARDQPLGFLQSLSALHCKAQAVLWPSHCQKSPSSSKKGHRGSLVPPTLQMSPVYSMSCSQAGLVALCSKVQASEVSMPVHSSPLPTEQPPPALQDSLPRSPLHPLGAARALGVRGGWSSPGLLWAIELS